MNPQLKCDGTPGQAIAFHIDAMDDAGNKLPAAGTATIDDYTNAYVAQTTPKGDFQIRPKGSLPAGALPKTVTATFNLKDAMGNSLPLVSQSVDLVPPPAPPQPTHAAVTDGPIQAPGSTAPDPGSATINVNV